MVGYNQNSTLEVLLGDINAGHFRLDTNTSPHSIYPRDSNTLIENNAFISLITSVAIKKNTLTDSFISNNFSLQLTLTKIHDIITDFQLNGPVSEYVVPPLNSADREPVLKATMYLGTNITIKDHIVKFDGAVISGISESSTPSAVVPYSMLDKTRTDLQNQIKHNAYNIIDLKDKIENFDIGTALTTFTTELDTVKSELANLRSYVQNIHTNLYQSDISVNPNLTPGPTPTPI